MALLPLVNKLSYFEIEDRLRQECDIPVFHDDQHGTAIVVGAAMINANRIVKKDILFPLVFYYISES